MEQNDSGREPTDAELMKALAAAWREYAMWWDTDEMEAVLDRAREYLSGARPMPDATDEVAQLRAEVERMQDGLRDSRAETAAFSRQITRDKDEIAELEQEHERKLRQVIETWTIRCDAHRGATEAAEARIAELEAENTALVAKLNTIRIWSITEDDRIGMFAKGYASARRWVAMYF